jgi:hypothetical protein
VITDAHSRYSSARENVLEHLFIGEMLRTLWIKGKYEVEVLRSEVDDRGYDVVIECDGVLRHIQLKTSYRGSKTRSQNVNSNIAKKSGGCVVWILFDAESLKLGPFRYLGEEPGKKLDLGNRPARHTRANSQGVKATRQNVRKISQAKFQDVSSIAALAEKLFATKGDA